VGNELAQLALSLLVLVLGAGLEEILPKFFGVGFPVLLCAVMFFASHSSIWRAVVFAVAAGGVEDAISSLPAMTSVSYFLAVSLLSRWSGLPRSMAVFAYCGYQAWLWAWVGGLHGGVFSRFLMSLPVGAVTAVLTGIVLSWAEGKAAIDESE
jgi:hypothetical protein